MTSLGVGEPMPPRLAEARDRFAEWRRTREKQTIPDELWSLAVELGGEFGVWRTARALGLNGHRLSQRMIPSAAATTESTCFIEIVRPEGLGRRSEVRIELEGKGGRRLRIDLRGVDAAEVATLAARLWREAR